MRLTIISHTPHYLTKEGQIVGWGPTIREINHLASFFSEIIHLAPLHKAEAPKSSIPYQANIQYVPLKPSGGKSFLKKIGVLVAAIYNALLIVRYYQSPGWFHLRAPANIMLYALPLLKFSGVRRCWIKYAGSWRDDNIPPTYKWQRQWLRKYFGAYKVTVNGRMPHDPVHILGFENPCLDNAEIDVARNTFEKKSYEGRMNICFVGQLEVGKGILNLLGALLPLDEEDAIDTVHVVGDGSLRKQVEEMAMLFNRIKIVLHGYLPRQEINDVYAASHFNILPSESEGFPKVIAEGAAYGAIPVVTNMSSLSEYIYESRGRLLNGNSPEEIKRVVNELLQLDKKQLKAMALNALEMANLFTYEHNIERIREEIVEFKIIS